MTEFLCAERVALGSEQPRELLFRENPARWVLLPVEYPSIFKFYKALENQYWTPSPLIWDRASLLQEQIGPEPRPLVTYCVFVDLKLFKGFPSHAELDVSLYADVLDQLCAITEYIQSPEARAFVGFEQMLEDFHREALNAALAALNDAASIDAASAVDSEICFPHVRHTCSKALWVKHHLGDLAVHAEGRRLPGDQPASASHCDAEPCFAEVLATIAISKGMLQTCAAQLLRSHVLNLNAKGALLELLDRYIKDLFLFSDFYAHLYDNLAAKLAPTTLFRMVTEASLLEFAYLSTVFNPLIETKLLSTATLGNLIRATSLRTVSALGASTADFQQYFKQNEASVVAATAAICWPEVQKYRGTKFDNSDLPYVAFEPVPGEWLSAAELCPPVTGFASEGSSFYVPTDAIDQLQMPRSADLGVLTTNATTTTQGGASSSLQLDHDF